MSRKTLLLVSLLLISLLHLPFASSTTPPTVSILQPSDGAYIPSSSVNVTWQGDDDVGIDHYEVRLTGSGYDSGWIDVGLETTHVFSDLSDGTYTVNISAYDLEGLTAYATASFTVDTIPPTITVRAPVNNTVLNTTTAVLEWEVSDNFGINNVLLLVDSELIGSFGPNDRTHTLELSEGGHAITLYAYDYAANIGTAMLHIVVDLTPPSVVITYPINNTYTRDEVEVTWWFNDNVRVDHLEVLVDGAFVTELGGTNLSYTLHLAEGPHIVEVAVYDVAGYVNVSCVMFTVDVTPPEVSIAEPLNGSLLASPSITVRWSANDNYLLTFTLIYEGPDLIDYRAALVADSITLTVDEGWHVVHVKVLDGALNSAEDEVRFAVDLTPPEILITSPTNGSTVESRNVWVRWNASDEFGIDHFEIQLDNGDWIAVGLNNSYLLTELSDGEHTVVVKAIDLVGHTATSSVTFAVSIPRPAPSWPIVLALLLAAIGGLLLFLFFWRRKKREEEEQEEGEIAPPHPR